jgi:hypothetical protein
MSDTATPTSLVPEDFKAALDAHVARLDAGAPLNAGDHDDRDDDFEEDTEDLDDTGESHVNDSATPDAATRRDPPAKPDAESAWFTPELSVLADAIGISPDEAQEFGSAKALAAHIKAIGRRQSAPTPEKQPPAQAEQPKPFNWRDSFTPEAASDLDEQLVKVFDGFQEQLRAKDEELKKTTEKIGVVDQIKKRNDEDNLLGVQAWMDSQFTQPEYESLFGKGKANEILGDKEKLANRTKVWNAYFELYPKYPKEAPADIFERAVALEFHKEIRNLGTRKRDKAVEDRGRQKIGKPGRSISAPVKPEPRNRPLSENRALRAQLDNILAGKN